MGIISSGGAAFLLLFLFDLQIIKGVFSFS